MLGVLFALIALIAGWAMCRLLAVGLALAPATGLGVLAVVTSWAISVGLPLTPALAVVVVALVAAALIKPDNWLPSGMQRWTVLLLALAAVLPAACLGFAFAGLDVPLSNHDGVFHVETIDALRRGVRFDTWYPRGFHSSIAAVLGLAPWVNSARGTVEAAQGLAILAPLAVFGLGLALKTTPLVAAVAAVILALTFSYPYDYQIWGGWPLGMGVVLALGVWSAALAWIARPRAALAAVVGLLAGGIVLTHGTEVYTAALGLAVIAVARRRDIDWRAVGLHLPLAVGLSLLLSAPYLSTLLVWGRGGGATGAAVRTLESAALDAAPEGGPLWVQVSLGAIGAGTLVDWSLRAVLVLIGLRQSDAGLARALWVVFGGALVAFAFGSLPVLDAIFKLTFPWLADQRLLQITSVLASLLAARGLVTSRDWLVKRCARIAPARPNAARRLALTGALLAALLAESSGVSVYKRLANASANDSSFTRDDRTAMDWLRLQARPGDLVANDSSVDAGIWTPFTAGLPILLPRSAPGDVSEGRQIILDNVADLGAVPAAEAAACQLGVRYVYYGARLYGFDQRQFPPLAVLTGAHDLQEVFRSGDAVVFQTRLACP